MYDSVPRLIYSRLKCINPKMGDSRIYAGWSSGLLPSEVRFHLQNHWPQSACLVSTLSHHLRISHSRWLARAKSHQKITIKYLIINFQWRIRRLIIATKISWRLMGFERCLCSSRASQILAWVKVKREDPKAGFVLCVLTSNQQRWMIFYFLRGFFGGGMCNAELVVLVKVLPQRFHTQTRNPSTMHCLLTMKWHSYHIPDLGFILYHIISNIGKRTHSVVDRVTFWHGKACSLTTPMCGVSRYPAKYWAYSTDSRHINHPYNVVRG